MPLVEQLEEMLSSYARNRARVSLDGDFGSLEKYWPPGQAGRLGLKRVKKEREALRRAEASGGFRYMGVEADVRLGSPETVPRGVLVPFRERLDRRYEKQGRTASYALVRTHRALCVPRGDAWVLAEDSEDQEGQRMARLRPVLGGEPGPYDGAFRASAGGPVYRRAAAAPGATRTRPPGPAARATCSGTSWIASRLMLQQAPSGDGRDFVISCRSSSR